MYDPLKLYTAQELCETGNEELMRLFVLAKDALGSLHNRSHRRKIQQDIQQIRSALRGFMAVGVRDAEKSSC